MDKKVALVTGASSGIGEAIAAQLAAAGYQVYGTSRRGADGLKRAYAMIALDVTSDDSVQQAVATVLQKEGRIDLLVNNAGFGMSPAGAEESSLAQAQALFDTNFFGAVRMTRAVLPHMRDKRAGRIIHIGSVLGFLPMPYGALYAASKHAIEGYSESLDHEVRQWGIHSIVVEPAYTKTAFEANALEADSQLSVYHGIRIALAARIKQLMDAAEGPSVVATAVLKAARAPRPKLRYTAGALAGRLRFLRTFAPAGVLDAGLRKDLKLA
jgi:NAD(P)-dependent dehydrogenase (short-subunit alcohol dehydrogenase family)